MDEMRPKTGGHRLAHLLMLLGTGLFHIACYTLVNRVTRWASLPIHDYSLVVDHWIPYIGWTWTFYYLGNIYVIIYGGLIVWKLPHRQFHRAVHTYLAMILIGALFELLCASASPWPSQMVSVQQHVHEAMSLDLYACLPSMHVALTIFPTCLSFSVFRSRLIRTILVILTVLITISTLTFKEHVFLDAVAGILLALVFYAVWRSDGRRKQTIVEG
jgi:hypothetical protein